MAKRDYGSALFASEMKKTLEKAEAKGNTVTAINIRLDKIDENPDNNQVFNMDDIERLANTIKQDGFSGAIEVFLKDDGRYEISAGHRRCRAVKLLGWDTIPAIVSQADDEIKKRKKLVKSNINNRNMRPLDWARAFEYHKNTLYMEDAKASGRVFVPGEHYNSSKALSLWDRMEEDFGYKRRFMQKYLKLLTLIPELQEMVDKGSLPAMATAALGDESEEVQQEFLKMAKEQISILSAGEDENISLPASSVANIIKSVSAKQGRKENKEKRIEEYQEINETSNLGNSKPVSVSGDQYSGFVPQKEVPSPNMEAISFAPVTSASFAANNDTQKVSVDTLPMKGQTVPFTKENTFDEAERIISQSTDISEGSGSIEQHVENTPDIVYADADIIRVSNEIVLIANKAEAIKDRDRIMQSLNQIEEMIQVIKTRIEQ